VVASTRGRARKHAPAARVAVCVWGGARASAARARCSLRRGATPNPSPKDSAKGEVTGPCALDTKIFVIWIIGLVQLRDESQYPIQPTTSIIETRRKGEEKKSLDLFMLLTQRSLSSGSLAWSNLREKDKTRFSPRRHFLVCSLLISTIFSPQQNSSTFLLKTASFLKFTPNRCRF